MISVIVPVYKVEKYLHKCVDSILNQTYTDFELILVDDGSPDECPKICDEYVKNDNRIKVIHKENGGLSSARNAGLDLAKGEYIVFIDSDDFIHPNYLKLLYQALISANADISICNLIRVQDSDNVKFDNQELKDVVICDNYTIFEQDVDRYVSVNKLYKKEIFNDIRFPQNRLCEDSAIYYKCLYKCKKIAFIKNVLYFYVYNPNSILNSRFNEKRLDGIEFLIEEIKFFEKIAKIDNRYYTHIDNTVLWLIQAFYDMNKTYVYFNFKRNKKARELKKQIKKIFKKSKAMHICATYLPYYYFYFGRHNPIVNMKYFFYKLKKLKEIKRNKK